MNNILKELAGTSLVTNFYFIGMTLGSVANDCFLLFFHLSYYSIAYYIRLLRDKLNNNSMQASPWKGSKQILTHLYEASEALESIFSVPILYIITSKLVVVALNLFAVIYVLMKPNAFFSSSWILILLVTVITGLAHVLVVLRAADMPAYQVELSFQN